MRWLKSSRVLLRASQHSQGIGDAHSVALSLPGDPPKVKENVRGSSRHSPFQTLGGMVHLQSSSGGFSSHLGKTSNLTHLPKTIFVEVILRGGADSLFATQQSEDQERGGIKSCLQGKDFVASLALKKNWNQRPSTE